MTPCDLYNAAVIEAGCPMLIAEPNRAGNPKIGDVVLGWPQVDCIEVIARATHLTYTSIPPHGSGRYTAKSWQEVRDYYMKLAEHGRYEGFAAAVVPESGPMPTTRPTRWRGRDTGGSKAEQSERDEGQGGG